MNNINDLKEQFENLIKQGQELLEKMKENHIAQEGKKVRWKPKDGELYYFYTTDGNVVHTYYNKDYDCDVFHLETGNCFKTIEEAQKELDRSLAEQELLDMCDGSLNDNKLFEIEYDPHNNYFVVGCYGTITSSCYRFASEESARKAIDTLGTEKLKLIFRIED